ncbi:MAG: sulfurtransferase [Alphaproteobacteria bacterium]|nr:MAG: sulfurtransferase [Alphaproteobacteria bacterium]
MSYKADVTVEEVWAALAQDQKSVLIDVRTQAEWTFVGICDLSGTGKSPLLVSWQVFPHMEINPAFRDMVAAGDISRDSPLYFLCRSGVRSRAAAAAMTEAGYENCFNILGGFEGDLDDAGHRGQTGGWKASGLPWRQN